MAYSNMLCKAPLFWLACSFVSGILLSSYSSITTQIIIILFLIPLIVLISLKNIFGFCNNLKKNFNNYIIIALSISFLILGNFAYSSKQSKFKSAEDVLKTEIQSAKFEILAPPDIFINGKTTGKWKTTAKVISINQDLIKPSIIVTLSGKGKCSLFRSEIITANNVLIIQPDTSKFPNGFSKRKYLHSQNISTKIKILGKYYIKEPQNFSLLRKVEQLRIYAIQNVLKFAQFNTQGFVSATIFGNKKSIDKETIKSFRDIGIGHILAISGLHVGLIILIISFICKSIRLSPRQRALVCIICCIIFLGFSGGRSSVVRACTVAIIYLGGILFFRKSSFINSLGAAALILTILNPFQIYNIGFQLSFISVIFISMISHKTTPYLQYLRPKNKLKNKPLIRFIELIPYNLSALSVVTLSAWLGILPLIAYYFSQVSVIGFLSNLIIIPLMPLAITGGILLQLAPVFSPQITPIFSKICSLPAHFILQINNYLSSLPVTSVKIFPPSGKLIALYYALFITLFICPFIFKKSIKKINITVICLLIATITILFYLGNTENKQPTTSISLLRNKGGESLIIQGTKNDNKNNSYTILIVQDTAFPKEIINYLYLNHISQINELYFISKKPNIPEEYYQWLNIFKSEIIFDRTNKQTSQNTYRANKFVTLNLTRNKSGHILWYNIINKNLNILITNWQKKADYLKLMKNRRHGYNSKFKLLRITGKERLKKDRNKQKSEYIIRDKNFSDNIGRKQYGLINITSKNLKVWDGMSFILLNKKNLCIKD